MSLCLGGVLQRSGERFFLLFSIVEKLPSDLSGGACFRRCLLDHFSLAAVDLLFQEGSSVCKEVVPAEKPQSVNGPWTSKIRPGFPSFSCRFEE